MEKLKVANGIHWVSIPEADVRILCGCPADSVKHLIKRGLIMKKEKGGVTFDTGPNVILLSDVPIQKGRLSNLGEFPVLQMFYFQGMLIPNHPNNTGIKPIICGTKEAVEAQAEYIYRGNYGLVSLDEILETGTPLTLAEQMMRIKLFFAFNRIQKTEEMLETCVAESEPVEIRNGVTLQRIGMNIYEFKYKDESAIVDLNLGDNEEYEASYHLGFFKISREYFSIIHTGEGDGWDINRPCMSSIVMHQGRIYLIDAGPSIIHSLNSLGISVNEIEGIFHTHAHDDHFSGLTVLLRADHKIKHFATPLVRASIKKKLAALMRSSEDSFETFFDIHDLEFDTWNDIDGLEVKPVYSPHPLETSIMFFRAMGHDGYKTYAHLADIASINVLDKMITDDPAKNGMSIDFRKQVRDAYMTPSDLKKIDIGGGLIHGQAEDFVNDKSARILLSHTAAPLSNKQKQIGDSTSFGMEDILIPGHTDYLRQSAIRLLRTHFPTAPEHHIDMLANSSPIHFNPGAILIRKDSNNPGIFLILSGVLELITPAGDRNINVAPGSIIGDYSALTESISPGTYRAKSHVSALEMPNALFLEFIARNGLEDELKHEHSLRAFLQDTWLFGEMTSYSVMNRIINSAKEKSIPGGTFVSLPGTPELMILKDGEMELRSGDMIIDILRRGDFFGEAGILSKDKVSCGRLTARTVRDCSFLTLPGDLLKNIPIVMWKMIETCEVRDRMSETIYDSVWRNDYRVNVKEMDDQHMELFSILEELGKIFKTDVSKAASAAVMERFYLKAKTHFDKEEELMKSHSYPMLDPHKSEHEILLDNLRDFIDGYKNGVERKGDALVSFLLRWLMDHIIRTDEKYETFFNALGVF